MAISPATAVRGAGIGLRSCHYAEVLGSRPPVPWFEILSDNYLGGGGLPLYQLEQVRRGYPVTLHGVGMSLGSADPLDRSYLARLKRLIERIEPAWVSEHLAWISIGGRYLHELLPLPYTQECLHHVASRVLEVQDFLGRRLLIENPSTYLTFRGEDMTEWEFLTALVELTDCELLLDLNNAYVSAVNHGWDAAACLTALPAQRIREIHLAGYEQHEGYLFDTHGHRVHGPVWALYAEAIRRLGPVPTLIEWDTDIPSYAVLAEEAAKAQAILDEATP
jgi:uncharacterized protein (UPF0276 family)